MDAVEREGVDARRPLDADVIRVNQTLREVLPPEIFVDLIGTICTDSCPLLTPDGNMISYDGTHLTRAGAVYVGQRIFTETPLQRFSDPEN